MSPQLIYSCSPPFSNHWIRTLIRDGIDITKDEIEEYFVRMNDERDRLEFRSEDDNSCSIDLNKFGIGSSVLNKLRVQMGRVFLSSGAECFSSTVFMDEKRIFRISANSPIGWETILRDNQCQVEITQKRCGLKGEEFLTGKIVCSAEDLISFSTGAAFNPDTEEDSIYIALRYRVTNKNIKFLASVNRAIRKNGGERVYTWPEVVHPVRYEYEMKLDGYTVRYERGKLFIEENEI